MSRYKTILRHLETPESKEIFRLFMKPFFKYKGEEERYHSFLENSWFNLPTRASLVYRSTSDFSMPGLWFRSPTSKIQTLGPREVKKDDILYVRWDQTVKDEVQIEIEDGSDGPFGRVKGTFALSDSQYFDIGDFMSLLDFQGVEYGGWDSGQ